MEDAPADERRAEGAPREMRLRVGEQPLCTLPGGGALSFRVGGLYSVPAVPLKGEFPPAEGIQFYWLSEGMLALFTESSRAKHIGLKKATAAGFALPEAPLGREF